MEIVGFSRETHDTARKWAHDTVLDEYSFFGRVLGLQGWALPVLSSWGQCSLGMLSQILNFQAFSWGIFNTCTHPMARLFHVRSGRLPQPLQVLMFALPKPWPQHTALTSWRLWNHLELMSGTLQTPLHLVLKCKMQEVRGWMIQIFCMQNFSSDFSVFSAAATWGYCWLWVLFMEHKYISKVILCPYNKTDACSVCYSSPYLYRTLFRLENGKLELDPKMGCLKIAAVFQSMCKPYFSFFLNSPFFSFWFCSPWQ